MLLWVEAGQRGGAGTALPKVMARDAHQRDRGAEQQSWNEMDTAQQKGLSIGCPVLSAQ